MKKLINAIMKGKREREQEEKRLKAIEMMKVTQMEFYKNILDKHLKEDTIVNTETMTLDLKVKSLEEEFVLKFDLQEQQIEAVTCYKKAEGYHTILETAEITEKAFAFDNDFSFITRELSIGGFRSAEVYNEIFTISMQYLRKFDDALSSIDTNMETDNEIDKLEALRRNVM